MKMYKIIDFIEEKLDLGCALEFMCKKDIKLSFRIANLITRDWLRELIYKGVQIDLEHIIDIADESNHNEKLIKKYAEKAMKYIREIPRKERK